MMPNAFFQKLRQVASVTSDDEALLGQLLGLPLICPPRHVLVQQGDRPKDVNLIVDGIATLQQSVGDESPTISGLLLPGDLCCTSIEVNRRATSTVVTLTHCSVIKISQRKFDRIEQELPHIVRGLWRLALAEQGIAREWFVNVASRPANKRMAHFFCEILTRLHAVGLAKDGTCLLPLDQNKLGSLLGISNVHANRMLKDLREANLVKFDGRRLVVPHIGKLKDYCQFSSDYLLLSAG